MSGGSWNSEHDERCRGECRHPSHNFGWHQKRTNKKRGACVDWVCDGLGPAHGSIAMIVRTKRPWHLSWAPGINPKRNMRRLLLSVEPGVALGWVTVPDWNPEDDDTVRLICAAPEMYEALRGALDAISTIGSIPGGPSDTARRIIEGALAKANGKP
jgi:hypothetical protein